MYLYQLSNTQKRALLDLVLDSVLIICKPTKPIGLLSLGNIINAVILSHKKIVVTYLFQDKQSLSNHKPGFPDLIYISMILY